MARIACIRALMPTGVIAPAVLCMLLGAADARAQGIAYEISPAAAHLRWSDALGFDNDFLYGARVGLRFGHFVDLQGYFFTRPELRVDPTVLPSVPGFVPPAGEQNVDIRAFGANVALNFSSGRTVPFVRAGAGVLQLNPADWGRSDQILLKAGGGLRFGLAGGLEGEVFAENWAFRLNRFQLFAPADAFDDPEADDLRHNLALGAALNIPLGGDRGGPGVGLRGAAFALEPIGGRLEFADELNLARQNLLGARAGLDFGRLVGVRGFYWRGMNDDFDDTAPIEGYGGEVQFNVGGGPGISPYLVTGAGEINFREGFRDELGQPRSSQTMLILGGGAALALSERVRLNVGLRDYIMSEGRLEDVRRTDQLFHNWLLNAGISFAVGGTTPTVRDERALAEAERLRAETERLRREQEERFEQLRTEQDEQIRQLREEQEQRIERLVAENERLRRLAERRAELRDIDIDPEERVLRAVDPRTLAIPVPVDGEITIRFGDAAAPRVLERPVGVRPDEPGEVAGLSARELQQLIREVVRDEVRRELPPQAVAPDPTRVPTAALSPAEVRDIVREALREELLVEGRAPAALPPGLTDEQRLALLEQRLAQRVDNLLARQLAEQERRFRQLEAARPPTTVVVPREVERAPPPERPVAPPVAPQPPAPEDPAEFREPHRFQLHSTRPMLGVNVSDPTQLVLGGRADLGLVRPGLPLPLKLVPEAVLGWGEGPTTAMFAGNLQLDFLPPDAFTRVAPYVNSGLALWLGDGLDLTLNAGYGASILAGATPLGPMRVFIEHQGIALFSRHRLLFGTQFQW
jgi:hypothetical protein